MWSSQGGIFINNCKTLQQKTSKSFKEEEQVRNCSYLEPLSEGIIVIILSYLEPHELGRVSRVSKQLHKISDSNAIWKRKYEEKYESIYIDSDSVQSYKYWYKIEFTNQWLYHFSFRYRASKKHTNKSNFCCSGTPLINGNPKSGDNIIPILTAKQKLQQGVKVVMLGDAGAGKSCILLRFSRDTFNENQELTIG